MAEQRVYEVMFIIDAGVSDDEVTRLSEGLQQIITDQGGTITKNENMGRRNLAYPIDRKNEGIYVLFEIEGSGREIAELERRMRVNDQIIRYITVRVDEDRRRAEKFKAKRARKASKRPFASRGGDVRGGGGGGGAATATAADEDEA
ncbi:MAG TPA: 30S ribosomal protein S6 [Pyrinomonadaceae bacterium]|nr:30S ribosomal protein S6 [Pyrinomonadaceae bacterium]